MCFLFFIIFLIATTLSESTIYVCDLSTKRLVYPAAPRDTERIYGLVALPRANYKPRREGRVQRTRLGAEGEEVHTSGPFV